MSTASRTGGWVPNYHGAWAMVIAPPITGILLTSFTPAHLIFLVAWWSGYFAYFAGVKWLRARRKERFQAALVTYSSISTLALGVLLIVMPALAWWALIFGPLLGLTAFLTWKGQERSLLNDIVTVVAASLSTLVAAHISPLVMDAPATDPHYLILATASLTAYFVGTAFYVKTNIRERGNETFFLMAVAYHVIAAVAVTAFVIGDELTLPHAIVWWVLVARTFAVATYSARVGHRVSAKAIGIGEVVATIAVVATLVIGA